MTEVEEMIRVEKEIPLLSASPTSSFDNTKTQTSNEANNEGKEDREKLDETNGEQTDCRRSSDTSTKSGRRISDTYLNHYHAVCIKSFGIKDIFINLFYL